MARAAGVAPDIVHVPAAALKTLGRPVVHWGEGTAGGIVVSITKALDHLDWAPRIGLEEGYRDSYAWYAAGGRDLHVTNAPADGRVSRVLAGRGANSIAGQHEMRLDLSS